MGPTEVAAYTKISRLALSRICKALAKPTTSQTCEGHCQSRTQSPPHKSQSKEDVDEFFTEFDRVASFYSWREDKKARELFHVPQLKGDTSRRFTSLDDPNKKLVV